jgi:type IV pilus assembly protein PilY1
VNYCDLFGATKADCDYTDYNWPTGLARTNMNFMDDVAFFLSHLDLRGDLAGAQTVRTFVVGYGNGGPMLQSIARAGKGKYYRADQEVALYNALTSALGEIRAPATP